MTESLASASGAPPTLIARRPLASFLVLAFSLSWSFLIADALGARGIIPFRLTLSGPGLILALLMSYGPTIAALVVAKATRGWDGVRGLLGALLRWRVGLRWYIVALALPPALFSLAARLPELLGGGLVHGIANGEELGWRGFALPQLMRRRRPLVASLTLGAIWFVFHVPIMFVPNSIAGGQSFATALPFCVGVLATSVLMTWLYRSTGGSVLLPWLFHGAVNIWPGLVGGAGGEVQLAWIQTALLVLVAAAVVVRYGPDLGPRVDSHRGSGNRQPATGKGRGVLMRTWLVRRRLLSRAALALGIVLLAALLVAVGYDRYAEGRLAAAYPAPGQFVTVSGARMHYRCVGSGEPTLALLAGFGGGALDWEPLMPVLAQHHRICAFDRLGQDWSDPAPQPRGFATAADELHSALEQLGISEPVVVGHSLGGALAQFYAARYPVSGLVLVDGLTADVAEPVVARLGGYQALDGLARLGLLRPLGGLFAHPAYPPEIRAEMVALRAGSAALLRITAEGALAAQSVPTDLRAAEERLDMPLLVIAAGASDVPELPAGAFQDAAVAFAARHSQAAHVVVLGAPHYVQATHPGEVAAAIEGWLTTIK